MTVDSTAPQSPLIRGTNENISALMFRMGWRQADVSRAIGISPPSVGRKMRNQSDWTLPELEAIADAMSVSLPELLGDLPDWEVWRARRDSNPKPSDP